MQTEQMALGQTQKPNDEARTNHRMDATRTSIPTQSLVPPAWGTSLDSPHCFGAPLDGCRTRCSVVACLRPVLPVVAVQIVVGDAAIVATSPVLLFTRTGTVPQDYVDRVLGGH